MTEHKLKRCSECGREKIECGRCRIQERPKWLPYPRYKPRPNQFVLVALGGYEKHHIIPLYFQEKMGFVYETACSYDLFEEIDNITHFMYVSDIDLPLVKNKSEISDES